MSDPPKWKEPKIVETIRHSPHMGMWGNDPSQWAVPKDLKDYAVERVLDRTDPDWLQYGDTTPDFKNPYTSPKALLPETLRMWKPESLRPARPKPAESRSRFGASSLGASIATLGTPNASLASLSMDTWMDRTFSIRTVAAFGGVPNWSKTVVPKLEPLQLATRSVSAPLLLAGQPASAYEDHASRLTFQSVTKFGNRQFDESASALEMAVRSDPRHVPVWRQRGHQKTNEGDYEGVIADCNEALRLDATHAETWAQRADAKLMKGDVEGAKRDCDESIIRDSRAHRVHNTRGICNFQLGDIEASMQDFENAKRLEPSVPDYWSGIAAGKVRLEDFVGAAADCSEAIRHDSHHMNAWVSRAAARNGLAQYEGAVADCNKAIQLSHTCVAAFAHRAYAKIYLKDPAGALADCNRAIALNPKFARAWCTRGEAKFQQGQFVAAIADFDQAIVVDPDHARSWWYRGKASLAIGKYDAAQVASEHAYYLSPRIDDAKQTGRVAEANAKTMSAWKLPAMQRGLQGDLEHTKSWVSSMSQQASLASY